jgi:hypothetical protein
MAESLTPNDYSDDENATPQEEQLDNETVVEKIVELARRWGLTESPEMAKLRPQMLEAADYESAKPLFIAYREQAMALIGGPAGQEAGSKAHAAVMILMAALYAENHRLDEIEEFYYAELEDAETIATNLDDQEMIDEIQTYF